MQESQLFTRSLLNSMQDKIPRYDAGKREHIARTVAEVRSFRIVDAYCRCLFYAAKSPFLGSPPTSQLWVGLAGCMCWYEAFY